MANLPEFSVAIDADRTTLSVTDATSYVDPLRADVAVYFAAAKTDADNEETSITTTGDIGDPETDSSWSFQYTSDGWYKMRWIAVPNYDVSESYSRYDAVYSGGSVYRSKTNANVGQSVADTNYWEEVSDPTTLCDNKGTSTESQNCDTTIYERVFTANAQYGYAKLIADNSAWTEADDEGTVVNYDLFSLWLNGAIVCDERAYGLQGEVITRRIESKFGHLWND